MKTYHDNLSEKKLSLKTLLIIFILLSSILAAIFLKIESPQERRHSQPCSQLTDNPFRT